MSIDIADKVAMTAGLLEQKMKEFGAQKKEANTLETEAKYKQDFASDMERLVGN